jgi:hypothetical protein
MLYFCLIVFEGFEIGVHDLTTSTIRVQRDHTAPQAGMFAALDASSFA